MPHKPGTGAIFGIVSENAIAKSNSPVYLLDMRRDLGVGQSKIISVQKTRPDGGFTFSGLSTEYSDYALMASDEDGVTPKNALIQDRVIPVPAHAGTGDTAEWFTRIMKDGAGVGIITWPNGGSIYSPMGIQSSVLYSADETPPTEIINIPDHPAMAGVRTNPTGAMSTYGRQWTDIGGISNASIEAVVDLDSAGLSSSDMVIHLGAVRRDQSFRKAFSVAQDSYYDLGTTLFRVKYNFTTRNLDFIANSNNASDVYIDRVLASFSLSSYTGITHIILAFTSGSSVDCYINGSLLSSVATTETMSHGYTAWQALCLIVGGDSSVNSDVFFGGGDYIHGPVVGYDLTLSAQQANDHYKALFDNTLIPIVTGYEKALMAESPMWYFRMNETDFSKGFSSAITEKDVILGHATRWGHMSADIPGNLTGLLDSPITGANSFSKDAGNNISGLSSGTQGFSFDDQAAFTLWVYFDNATPTGIETLMAFEGYKGANELVKVTRGLDGKIKVDLSVVTGTTETISFDYAPPSLEWVNIWIVIDKVNSSAETAKLYAGSEASSPTLEDTQVISSSKLRTMALERGEFYPQTGFSSSEVGTGLDGRVCEIAYLPTAITLERIAAIWSEKDTP